jgi:hypothetical protein
MKRILMATLIGVLACGPAFGASLNDLFSGVEDSFSKMWHADIFPDDVDSEDQALTQTPSAVSAVELIIVGVFGVFITGLLLRREWLVFVNTKNDFEEDRFVRIFKIVFIGAASLILGVFFIGGWVAIFMGCTILLE